MLKYAVILGLLGVAAVRTGSVQQPRCSPDPQRRLAAVTLTRLLNSEEARFFSAPQPSSVPQRYGSLSELGIGAGPDGFQVQLLADGTRYMFTIKDTVDVCHPTLFSDQEGLIYTAQPLQ
jgi:hypothetical protein